MLGNKNKTIDKDTAKKEYERWCNAWKIGRQRIDLKGDSLEQVEAQEKIIIGLIERGLLSLDNKNSLNYKLEEPTNDVSEFDIPRPKGDMLMEGDRFGKNETMHRAYAMVAGATGYPIKTIIKLEYNTDITNLMAVIGHFLTA